MALTESDIFLNGLTFADWEALEELLHSQARSAVFYEAMKSKNKLVGLFDLAAGMKPEVRSRRYTDNYNTGFANLVCQISANPVYVSISGDPSFRKACAEFRRLRKSGKDGYCDPFSELRFMHCFVNTLEWHYIMRLSKKAPKVAPAKTRQAARATAKKLLHFFSQSGLSLTKYSEEATLKRGLTLLISEIDGNIKVPRLDQWTRERLSVEKFARIYHSYFGSASASVARSFAAMIEYGVAGETLKGQLKGMKDFEPFKPETIVYEGEIGDPSRGFSIDRPSLLEAAKKYVGQEGIYCDALDWYFLDSLVFAELDAFNVATMCGGAGFNFAWMFAEYVEWKYFLYTIFFGIFFFVLRYLAIPALALLLVAKDYNGFALSIGAIWAIYLMQRVFYIPTRWRVKKLTRRLSENLLTAYSFLGQSVISPARFQAALNEGAKNGVVYDGALFAIADRVARTRGDAFLPFV